jgi:translocation protein SEC63
LTEKYDVAPTAVSLIESFLVIANAFNNVQPVMAAYHAQQHLIQAMPPGGSPLLQLPHFDAKIIRAIEGENARTHLTIGDFMDLPNAQRKKLTVGAGKLTENQYKQAMQVARQMPHVEIEKAFFKVTGEKVVLPQSLVSLVIKARVIPPGSQNVPEVKDEDLEDVDPPEGDLDALNGQKKKNSNEERAQPPLVHSPYYARDYSPRWHLFLADSKQGKIAVPPSTYLTFEKPIFDSEGKPTFNVQTIKMQFGAPPQPGQYTFALNYICDGYVGFDSKIEITLEVEDPSNVAEVDSEDDISEPDEGKTIRVFTVSKHSLTSSLDTIAGQMSALKGGPVKQRTGGESSDDDSDTEGEEESESETDTETESDEE